MIKSAEATGKDIESAKAAARKALGIGEDEGSYRVLEMPKKGFLGLFATKARVRVSIEVPDGEEKKSAEKKPQEKKAPEKAAPEKKPQEKKSAEKKVESAPRPQPVRVEQPAESKKTVAAEGGSREEQVESFLSGLLERMGIQADIAITAREGGGLDVELSGKDMGAVIGRRGETLDAIQHLVNYALNRGGEKHMHINVDAENYRSKREESLVHLAEKMAAKALKYKRSMALEPMNSYERHVIHTALQNYEGVTTSSIGTEPNRRVVVSCTDAPARSERPSRDRRSDRRRSDRGERSERKTPAPAVVEEEKLPEIEAEPVLAAEVPVAEVPVAEVPVAEPVSPAPAMPEGYEPVNKNKPASREWC